MDTDTALELLGDAIDRQAATVLVGAGLSQGAGYPGWSKLLEPFFDELETDPDAFVDLPLLAQYVANGDGGRVRLLDHVATTINDVTSDPNTTPTTDHRLVVALPVDELWTTNYDPMLERADPTLVPIESDHDFVKPDRAPRRLNKMHGSIRPDLEHDAAEIVITRDDYDRYEQLHPRAWHLLEAQFLTKSFLFLGFSLTDPNFEAVFRLVRTATPDRYMDHIALVPREDITAPLFEAKCADLERSGVHVVTINKFAEITDFLHRLGARTRPQRLYVSGSYPDAGPSDVAPASDDNYPTRPTNHQLDQLAVQIGQALGTHNIKVAAGSKLCSNVVYGVMDALKTRDPDQGWVLRRSRNKKLSNSPRMRKGTIKFIGSDPEEMRDAAFDHIRAVLVIGGREGTRAEIRRARERGMGVVPVAVSGGTAQALWAEMRAELTLHDLGGRPIDKTTFDQLNEADTDAAINAAISLVRQALFL